MNTPSSQPAYLSRVRDKRRAGFLSAVSVILIVLMLGFELAAVLLIRQQLFLSWDLDREKQETVDRLDVVRRGLRKLKPSTADQANEKDWVSKELNIVSGHYREREYKISLAEIRLFRQKVALFENLWDNYWSQGKYLIGDVTLNLENVRESLGLPKPFADGDTP